VNSIKEFWLHSWYTDRVAFLFEIISFVFTVGASLTLALTADAPDMRYVYPGFFIGSLTAVYAYYRRKLAWPMMLTGYFAFVNVFGFGVANQWW
jgi:hypothetical protein